jgi:hypothetical protein
MSMFGGSVRPSHKGRTADSEHGGAKSGKSLHDATRGTGEGEPEPEAAGIEGDGMHHHEIHETEDGMMHSKHTHPDGQVTHEDHPDLEHAKEHLDRIMGHEDLGKEEGAEETHNKGENDDDQPDFSAAYRR